jgi:hypothetical protein
LERNASHKAIYIPKGVTGVSFYLWLRAVALAFAAAHAGGKTVNVPNSTKFKRKVSHVFSSSQYDGHGGLNHHYDVVNSGRACVHCDDRADRYYKEEARIA